MRRAIRFRAPAGVLRSVAGLFSALIALIALGCCLAATPAEAAVTELRYPSGVIQPDGGRAAASAVMPLPFSWDPLHGAMDGSAEFRFDFPTPDGDARAMGLYFDRIGNRYAIWLNGEPVVDRISGYSAHYNFGKEPHYYVLPSAILRPENVLIVRIIAEGGRLAGLSPPLVGPESEIEQHYREQYRAQSQSALVLCLVAAIFGVMGLLIWWRERDRQFLYFAGAALCWSLRTSDQLLDYVPLDWRSWAMVLATAYTGYVFLSFKFAFEVPRLRGIAERRLSRPIGYLFLPALGIALAAIAFHWVWLWRAWRTGILLFTVGGAGALVWLALRRRTLDHAILAAAFTIGVSCGLFDYLETLFARHTHSGAPLSRYGSLLMIMSFLWILMERYVAAQRSIARSRDKLAEMLADRERELAGIYEARARAERDSAVTEERQRITRDLHDGLGMQITTAIHLAARPDAPREQITRQLRETLEQLKLTVDALEDVGNDLGAVLGNIRFRLSGRIESSGLALCWNVDRLPMLPDLTSGKVRHIQFIVLEAITNAINHSGAKQLTIRAWHDAEEVRIAIQDDGAGFDPAAPGGRGMTNMRMRAQALGAVLQVASLPGSPGTTVELRLPLAA